MTAVDLAAIREALELRQRISGPERPRGNDLMDAALAALDRIEQNTLTAEEARMVLSLSEHIDAFAAFEQPAKVRMLVAKLERIAGDTGEAT